MDWLAEITLTGVIAPAQRDRLAAQTGGTTTEPFTGRTIVVFTVRAASLAQATEAANTTIAAALHAAGTRAEPIGVQISADELVAHPNPIDLVDATMGGKMFARTRQWFEQRAAEEGFPAPVAVLSRGKVWARRAVEVYEQRRAPRKPGRKPSGQSSS